MSSRFVEETLHAIFTITYRFTIQSTPTIVSEALRMIHLGNFFQNGWNMLLIVGAVDTGYVKITRFVRLA